MFTAHIRPTTLEEQSVEEHLFNVSDMTKEYASKISLSSVGELIGVLHDMGKFTKAFNSYIQYSSMNPNDHSQKGSIDHSSAGAINVYDNFYRTGNPHRKLAVQLISLAICSHHGGLIDCLDLAGNDVYTNRMGKEKEKIDFNEATINYYENCLSLTEVGKLFIGAESEIRAILSRVNNACTDAKTAKFNFGMLLKFLFSCLIDADRYDTYRFIEGEILESDIHKAALWVELSDRLEVALSKYPKISDIDLLRNEISDSCKDFGVSGKGVYRLLVPTGGGKTLSSLRFALEHVKHHNMDRIIYVIPFTTIIDQNAKDIKNILGHEEMILEHHSNVLSENLQGDYKLLTERWDSPIILTTMVQFLDTLFSGGTQYIRRMHNLANSVIIFDEIQAIPIKCISLFNSAVNFLSSFCNTTVVLCTATQPSLSKVDVPLKLSQNSDIIHDITTKFRQFKRVNVLDRTINGGYSIPALRNFILDEMNSIDNILVILNTKNAAKELYEELKRSNADLMDNEKFHIYHLSTNMCPAHRLFVLNDIREHLKSDKVICISTQLIEAGINISFHSVIRSIAGLDNIAQAAGRCNRHAERACSNVYIVNVQQENVDKLIDIKKGQECMRRILNEFAEDPSSFDNDLLSPKAMERYYKYYFYDRRVEMNYVLPRPNNDKTIYDLLSSNNAAENAFAERNGLHPSLPLRQAFKTAGDSFEAIDQNTRGVLVPFEEGRELITLINGRHSLSEMKAYLNKVQQYSVNLYDTDIRKLEREGGIIGLMGDVILALREGFYRNDVGVTFDRAPMDFISY